MRKTIAAVVLLAALGACGTDANTGLPSGEKVDGTNFERRVIDGKDCLFYESGAGQSHVVAFDCDWSQE